MTPNLIKRLKHDWISTFRRYVALLVAIAIDNLGCVQSLGPLVPGEVFPATPGLSTIVIKVMDFAKGQSYHDKGPS